LRTIAAAVVVVGLAGCAGSVAPPIVTMALPKEARANLHLDTVSTEAAAGVALTAEDTNRISQLVLADIKATAPNMLDPSASQAKSVRVVITRYDEGNAAARFMLAGLGQIRLEGTVVISDRTSGQRVVRWALRRPDDHQGRGGGIREIRGRGADSCTLIVVWTRPKLVWFRWNQTGFRF
jgi:hypothetical protein